MIKNQKQASLTKEKLKMLLQEQEAFENSAADKGKAELLLGRNSFEALIGDLQAEINEYEQLTQGNLHIIEGRHLEDTARLLISARIAQKISQRELAQRLGIQEQQVQRYEATDYESANLARLGEIASALEIKCYYEKIIIICNQPSFEIQEHLTREGVGEAQHEIKERGSLLCIE
jgi:HTH-type transcriptional regulator/antitoxin HipB